MIDMHFFVWLISAILGFGFLVPIIWRTQKAAIISLWLALGASLFGAVVSGSTWLNILPLPRTFVIPWNLWEGLALGFEGWSVPSLQLEFRLDHLSAFFVFLVTSFSAIVATYSFGALNAPHYQRFRPRIASAFNLFVWATLMVLVAYDVFSLILSLEIMTVAFGYLVLYKHTLYQEETTHSITEEQRRNARIAPQVYLAISHTSTAFLLIALLILAIAAKGVRFDGLYRVSLLPSVSTIVFLLALVGLGIRAGLTPAHIWVPLVHPSSPTTTHALSLGIAIKVAIYLMYRFFFQFLVPQEWWGYLLLLVAVATALVNVWYAISSHDLKTALAYHSIENIGIICVGVGLGIIFWRKNSFIATLALVASLYHLLNHAIFKGLLYLATGAIDNLTQQVVDFDRLGGLIKRYGFTAAMFLVGSFAIAGFPPLNGFISEWLTLQALFGGLAYQHGLPFVSAGIILVSAMVLVASFALTAFCFYKMAGVALLGLPRSSESERAHWEEKDVPWSMRGVMVFMAIMCLFLGVMPSLIIPRIADALGPVGIQGATLNLSAGLPTLSFGQGFWPARLPILAMIILAAALFLGPLLVRRLRPILHPADAWSCGTLPLKPPVNQYTSSAASFLLRDLLGVTALSEIIESLPDFLPARIVLSRSARYKQETLELFRVGYNVVIGKALDFSEKLGHWLQNRDIRRYLWYIFWVDLVALLVFILMSVSKGN